MEQIKTVILEDNIEYIILDEITNDNKIYIYLANINDETDFCIRKKEIEENKQILIGLDSEEEFDNALNLYYQKNK